LAFNYDDREDDDRFYFNALIYKSSEYTYLILDLSTRRVQHPVNRFSYYSSFLKKDTDAHGDFGMTSVTVFA
jgi:hypothetical protein